MLRRLIERATRPPVLTGFAFLQAALVVVLVVRHAWTLDAVVDEGCNVVVGDFLAFHAGARLVATGEGRALYDLERQLALQEENTGCALERWAPYVNPPLLALVLAPFSAFDARTAFHLFGAAVVLALVVALVALVRSLPALGAVAGGRVTAGLLVFGFAPVAATLAGGQNTGLSLALAAGFYAALVARRDALAGTWLGLLSYKPTLLPVLLLAVALERRWRALAVACAIVLAHYVLGAAFVGADWPLRLVETGVGRRTTEFFVAAGNHAAQWEPNLPTHVSLLPFVERFGAGPLASFVGVALVAAVVLAVALVVRGASVPGPALWGVVFSAMLLASPHLPYYDVGLAALPVLLGVEARLVRGRPFPSWGRLALLTAYLGYPAHALSERLGVQPLVLVLVLVFAWLWREARQGNATNDR